MVSSTNTYSFKQGHPGILNSGDSPCYFVHLPKVWIDLTFTSSLYSVHPLVGAPQSNEVWKRTGKGDNPRMEQWLLQQ